MEKRGLTSSEAKEKLKEFGYNKLKEEKEKSFAQLLLGQVLNPMTGILAAAVVLSVILKDYSEAAIIFFVICRRIHILQFAFHFSGIHYAVQMIELMTDRARQQFFTLQHIFVHICIQRFNFNISRPFYYTHLSGH